MKDIKHEDSEEAKSASSHGSGARCIHERNIAPFDTAAATPRPAGSIYMGNFCAPKLDCIRIAIIGLGARGQAHAQYLSQLPGCRIIALCDAQFPPYTILTLWSQLQNGVGEEGWAVLLYHTDSVESTSKWWGPVWSYLSNYTILTLWSQLQNDIC